MEKKGSKYENIIEIAYDYIDKLEFETGTLEFGITVDGKLIFFEVNSMVTTLCFPGEDEKNMTNYYNCLFDNFFIK